MDTTRPPHEPEARREGWPADLTDQELDRALDRLLVEITARRGAGATAHIQDAMMRRF
jgi:hypothetical protein